MGKLGGYCTHPGYTMVGKVRLKRQPSKENILPRKQLVR
jgi:hypothetical protein